METIDETSVSVKSTAPMYRGRCFCGAVELAVTGRSEVAGYCHCESCRSWSASPVNAFVLWKPDAVTVTRGAEHIGTFSKTSRSQRKWCKLCGGHLFNAHPEWGLVDVYAATVPGAPFEPALHVNYQETKLRMKDGLPKLKDIPKEMGGSGIVIDE